MDEKEIINEVKRQMHILKGMNIEPNKVKLGFNLLIMLEKELAKNTIYSSKLLSKTTNRKLFGLEVETSINEDEILVMQEYIM